ncbi:hypothetical protein [Nocardioides sp. zg-1230]|uniref:hypothetical protein n=1 Tax=Nocardioides sp. zg-1230 TaxID=2736601 RepID=UPI0015543155|nr:hypothetical protein [Nocardioides sp. zg-1230]NPC44063.1 hypothetical protein [Nocardioides sp. zg-1230]
MADVTADVTMDDRLTNQELREAADRLLADRRDVPAGSVIRTFSRSVRTTLLDGFSTSEVVAEAERRTRELLAQRPAARPHLRMWAGVGVLAVPRPRRVR